MQSTKNNKDGCATNIEINASLIKGIREQGSIQWRNIPYAKAPVGDLRWQPPQPLLSLPASLDATLPEKIFIQPGQDAGTTQGEEANLFLNIYRPEAENQPYPVLFYIHGGNNQLGHPAEFSPGYLAQKLNCIVVTLNYRLGALGFNPLTALNRDSEVARSGNFALLDIHCALGWVHRSIAAFGGNADNITVCGFSSGGRNVMTMLISPLFKGLFQRAIAFSGGMTTSDKNASEVIFARHFAPWVVEAGIQQTLCDAENWLQDPVHQPEVQAWLMALPAQQVALAFKDANIRMDGFPHFYRDGYVIPAGGFENATYHDVPVILFSGCDEFSLFLRREDYFRDIIHPSEQIDYHRQAQYNFCLRYGSLLYKVFNTTASAHAIKKCPSYHSPVYLGIFHYGQENTDNFYDYRPYYSFHGIFLSLWDPDSLAKISHTPSRTTDHSLGREALEAYFNCLLSSFITTGQPYDSQIQATAYDWSAETRSRGQSVLLLDSNDKTCLTSYSNIEITEDDICRIMADDATLTSQEKYFLCSTILNGRWWSQPLEQYIGAK